MNAKMDVDKFSWDKQSKLDQAFNNCPFHEAKFIEGRKTSLPDCSS